MADLPAIFNPTPRELPARESVVYDASFLVGLHLQTTDATRQTIHVELTDHRSKQPLPSDWREHTRSVHIPSVWDEATRNPMFAQVMGAIITLADLIAKEKYWADRLETLELRDPNNTTAITEAQTQLDTARAAMGIK